MVATPMVRGGGAFSASTFNRQNFVTVDVTSSRHINVDTMLVKRRLLVCKFKLACKQSYHTSNELNSQGYFLVVNAIRKTTLFT